MPKVKLPVELEFEILSYIQEKRCKCCYKVLPKIGNDFCDKKCLCNYNLSMHTDIIYMRNGIAVLLFIWFPVIFSPTLMFSKYIWLLSIISALLLSIYIEFYFTRVS
jgi:hypothetical protein